MCSGNRVGVEGARALGDALKANTTLTKLRLDSMFLTVFDEIIVGDGPISRTLLFHINTSASQSVLVIDAGKRSKELAEKIKIESNINYDTPLKAPSFHIGKESHVWYGGCQGWPSNDTLDKNIDSLPISVEDPKFIRISNRLLRDL